VAQVEPQTSQEKNKVTQVEPQTSLEKSKVARPLMEACGIDVFKTARDNGFQIDTKKETYGKWNYFALVLLE